MWLDGGENCALSYMKESLSTHARYPIMIVRSASGVTGKCSS